jgi:hypothetical protein
MNNLKKSISIILFQKQLAKNSFVLILPALAVRLSPIIIKSIHGIKSIFLKNNILPLNISNISYLFFSNKQLLLTVLLQYKKTFLGFKFNNLYFSSKTLQNFNYLKFFKLKNFLLSLKNFYFYFLKYIFAFKKKIINN